jgi:hypothetical protein
MSAAVASDGWSIPSMSRREIESAIERLIALLDFVDGDPDLEDGSDDEPSLGWVMSQSSCPLIQPADPGDDREGEEEHDEETVW